VRFNKLAEKAKQAIDRRGGMDSLKQDLQEVKDAAAGRGTLKEKARAAADAFKTPGKNQDAGAARAAPPEAGAARAGSPEGGAPPTTPPSAA
jgi:hypothetical protein